MAGLGVDVESGQNWLMDVGSVRERAVDGDSRVWGLRDRKDGVAFTQLGRREGADLAIVVCDAS